MEIEGEQVFSLSDPSGIIEESLILHPGAAFIAAHLNGEYEIEEIHQKVEEHFNGESLPENTITDFVEQLDGYGFLDSPNFDAKYEAMMADFRDSPVRASSLAGRSYPDDPEELRAFLDEQFTREGAIGEAAPNDANGVPPLPGLIAPHIDLQRGGHCYSHGYHALASAGKPDTVIIFGVAHAAEPVPFILTQKNFETPFGTLETDRAIVDRLAAKCSWDPYEYELTHRSEHSIEFQALMLSYLYGPTVKIVPILTSYYGEGTEFLDEGETGAVQSFLEECRAIANESDGTVSVISSVDLAHVGRCFGDDFDINEDVVENVRARDHEDVTYIHTLNPEDFYRSVLKDDNERNVCGLKAIYAGLYTLQDVAEKAETLHYDYAHDPADGIVSFASIAIR